MKQSTLSIIVFITMLLFAYQAKAEDTTVVNMKTAGTLSTIITDTSTAASITKIKLTGPLNGDDFYYMRNYMYHLQYIDMEEANIVAGGAYYDDFTAEDNKIGDYMFYYLNNLQTVLLPKDVTSIGEFAFFCVYDLSNIKIPATVTEIKSDAFEGCESLSTLELPESLTIIGDYAFHNCVNLKAINISANVKEIGIGAFAQCTKLTGINIDKANTNYQSIEGVLFDKAGTTLLCYPNGKGYEYTVPNGVTTLAEHCFDGDSTLVTVTLPNSITTLKEGAFDFCPQLTDIVLPNTISDIPQLCFANCKSMLNLTLPESVTSIGNYAYLNCKGLQTVTLPKNLSTIGESVFAMISSIKKVYSKNPTPPAANQYAFDSRISSATLYVPVGSKESYAALSPWSAFGEIVEQNLDGITDLQTTNCKAYSINHQIVVESSNNANGTINVYGIDGRLINSSLMNSNRITLPINDAGIYIVRVNNQSMKVAVK